MRRSGAAASAGAAAGCSTLPAMRRRDRFRASLRPGCKAAARDCLPRPPPDRPGTGRTGFLPVSPNNYPFFKGDARYTPAMQPDGGQLTGATDPERAWRTSLQAARPVPAAPRLASCV